MSTTPTKNQNDIVRATISRNDIARKKLDQEYDVMLISVDAYAWAT